MAWNLCPRDVGNARATTCSSTSREAAAPLLRIRRCQCSTAGALSSMMIRCAGRVSPLLRAAGAGATPSMAPAAVEEEQQREEWWLPEWHEEPDGRWWYWQEAEARIYYRTRGTSGPPLLLCHGFGVGGYHFEAQLEALSSRYRVYAVDLLGQGRSWPAAGTSSSGGGSNGSSGSSSGSNGDEGAGSNATDQAEEAEAWRGAGSVIAGQAQQQQGRQEAGIGARGGGGLVYSVEMWTGQLRDFINEVIGGPSYVAGNSLGGYLAVCLAANHPGLVQGMALLNATPFWSFAPNPRSNPRLAALMPWDGRLPAPSLLRTTIDSLWWKNLSNESTVRSLLQLVYADSSRVTDDEQLVDRILQATRHPDALDAFTSIAFAPKAVESFDCMLQRVSCPLALVYGREDPWVVPLWGQRAKRACPDAAYFEISPAGHSPHHEAPEAVNHALGAWLDACEAAAAAARGGPEGLGLRVLSELQRVGPRQEAPQRAEQARQERAGEWGDDGGRGNGDGSGMEEAVDRGGGGAQSGVGPVVVWSQGGVSVSLLDGRPRNVFERVDAALARLRGPRRG